MAIKIEALEKKISEIAGVPVKLTIQDVRKFVFSFTGHNPDAVQHIQDYFSGKLLELRVEYETRTNETRVYITLKN